MPTHEEMYGKSPENVEYGDYCDVCGSRVDEFGYCACGAGSE